MKISSPLAKEFQELWNSDLRKWFLIGFVLHVLAAIFSTGYLHVDEHFQILEYLGTKLFNYPPQDLPWEYHEKMRPWAQHIFYYAFSWPLVQLGIKNPFFFHFCFRLFSAFLGMLAISSLVLYSKRVLQNTAQVRWVAILLNTIWFTPYLHARISSETVGGSIFAIAFSLTFIWLIENKKLSNWQSLAMGLLFGYSFLIRYHIGVIVFFTLIWALVFQKIDIRSFLLTSLSIALAISLGVLVDYWGYGEWTFAPWEYVKQNLLHDKASNYGVTPWWEYFKSVSKGAIQPFGWTILAAHLFIWFRKPLSLYTWMSLPFFAIHSYIPHKELRFLFPLALFIPFVLIEAYNLLPKMVLKLKENKFVVGLGKFLIFVNAVLAVQVALKPAHTSSAFYEYTYNMQERMHNLVVMGQDRPFWGGVLNFHYYNFHYPKTHYLKDHELTIDRILAQRKLIWVFGSRGKYHLKLQEMKECKLQYINYPRWLLRFNIGNWIERSRVWTLYRCSQD